MPGLVRYAGAEIALEYGQKRVKVAGIGAGVAASMVTASNTYAMSESYLTLKHVIFLAGNQR